MENLTCTTLFNFWFLGTVMSELWGQKETGIRNRAVGSQSVPEIGIDLLCVGKSDLNLVNREQQKVKDCSVLTNI